jgi:hypothetical protein
MKRKKRNASLGSQPLLLLLVRHITPGVFLRRHPPPPSPFPFVSTIPSPPVVLPPRLPSAQQSPLDVFQSGGCRSLRAPEEACLGRGRCWVIWGV